MTLLVLDIQGTIIPKYLPGANIPINPKLKTILLKFQAAGWTIVTTNTTDPSTATDKQNRDELRRAELDTLISAYYPEKHHNSDTKVITLTKYMQQFNVDSKASVYFYDDINAFIENAQKNGFENSFLISSDSLTDTLEKLAVDLKLDEEIERIKNETLNPSKNKLKNSKKSTEVSKSFSKEAEQRKSNDTTFSEMFAEFIPTKLPVKFKPTKNKSPYDLLNEVIPTLFIGPVDTDDDSLEMLAKSSRAKQSNPDIELKIAILRCTKLPNIIDYKLDDDIPLIPKSNFFVLLKTEENKNLKQHFEETFKFIKTAYEKKIPIVIQGDPRPDYAATLVAAFLMKEFQISATKARSHICNKRPSVVFASHLEQQLLDYEEELKAEKAPEEKSALVIDPVKKPSQKKNFFRRHWPTILIGSLALAILLTLTFVSLGFFAPAMLTMIATWGAVTFAMAGGIPTAIAVGEVAAITIGALLGGVFGKIYDGVKYKNPKNSATKKGVPAKTTTANILTVTEKNPKPISTSGTTVELSTEPPVGTKENPQITSDKNPDLPKIISNKTPSRRLG